MGISTVPRFIYLNAYAFLLLLVAVGIGIVPFNKIGWWGVLIQVILVLICLKGSYSIFSSWNEKKRKYMVLMERNKQEIRHDTFSEYMKAPCGRLLAKIVLKDLRKPDEYKTLRKMRAPFVQELKQNCTFAKTTVTIYRLDNPTTNPEPLAKLEDASESLKTK